MMEIGYVFSWNVQGRHFYKIMAEHIVTVRLVTRKVTLCKTSVPKSRCGHGGHALFIV